MACNGLGFLFLFEGKLSKLLTINLQNLNTLLGKTEIKVLYECNLLFFKSFVWPPKLSERKMRRRDDFVLIISRRPLTAWRDEI